MAQQARPAQPTPRPLPEPLVQLTNKAVLFAEAQQANPMPPRRPVQPAQEPNRSSLFRAVTGAFGFRAPSPVTAAVAQPVRHEPGMSDYQPQASLVSVQQAPAAEQTGLEIPAFLRRQHSH
jgi:hypothetical protein